MTTNDPGRAHVLIDRQLGGVVHKPRRNTPCQVDGRARHVWVREVRAHEITGAVAACPHLFQALVAKALDFAVTAAGAWCFLECNPKRAVGMAPRLDRFRCR
ncbi:hypothetical protein [Kitasatospora griseola]|uniref:hypothetical protein n=1 Tax=Kitasatospora griseola TaxID=2064 RepID=UPI00166F6A1D|nr:hypothetical protein [Kitasatospora griseola]GGQ91355.1 hypothetical protein GCM10010195_54090 [Kitasatospora griseola]